MHSDRVHSRPSRELALNVIDSKISEFAALLASAGSGEERYPEAYELAYEGADALLTELFPREPAGQFMPRNTGGFDPYPVHLKKCLVRLRAYRETIDTLWSEVQRPEGNADVLPIADVFISHGEADSKVAKGIATHLEQRGWRTWYYERDSLPGPPHLEQTGRQIEGCALMVVVVSRSAITSEFVTNEVFRGSEAKKRMIPVLVELEHEDLMRSNVKWAMVLGFSVSIVWDEKCEDSVLERIADGVSYLVGSRSGHP